MDDVCDFILVSLHPAVFLLCDGNIPFLGAFGKSLDELGVNALNLECASRLAGLIADAMQAFDQLIAIDRRA